MAPFSPLSSDQMEAFCDLLVGARNLIWPNYSEIAIESNLRFGYRMTWSNLMPVLVDVNSVDTQERRIPDVEQRLRTVFVLCWKSSNKAEEVAAAEAYIATMDPSVGDSFHMTSEIAVAVAAGFREITNAPFIPRIYSKKYCEVVQTNEYGKTLSFRPKSGLASPPKSGGPKPIPPPKGLKPLPPLEGLKPPPPPPPKGEESKYEASPPPPKGEKPKGGAPPPPPKSEKPKSCAPPPKSEKPISMRPGHVASCFRLISIGKLTEIKIIDELLYIWEGSLFSYCRQFVKEASVGFSVPLRAEVKLAHRELRYTKLSAEKLCEILDKLKEPWFWNWFHNIALKGMIKGDPGNCGRTGWFLKKAENVGEGVRLKRRWRIKEIQEFLGPATWTNSARDRMKFRQTVDAFLLCGSVVVSGDKPYLELEWHEEGTCDASGTGDKVPLDLKIGSA